MNLEKSAKKVKSSELDLTEDYQNKVCLNKIVDCKLKRDTKSLIFPFTIVNIYESKSYKSQTKLSCWRDT